MTTQWTADAYEGFSLSEAKKADCKRIAMILVHEALRHYQAFDSSVPRGMDAKRWKPIKSSNNVTMYQERNPSRRVVKDSFTDSAGWQMPRVVIGNGTISNSIDDLLYGLAYGDEAAALQGVSYSGSPVTNSQILSTIEKPTLEHPYRCTVLQWHAGSPSPAIRGIVKDRDVVYIRATGILQVGENERIGYNLLHSVDLPSTPPQDERGIIRSRVSTCNLFKPVGNQSVEVFIKGYYEVLGNSFLDSIAAVTIASALMDTWASGQCARLRKLSWLLQRKNVSHSGGMGSIWEHDDESESACQSCKKRYGAFRKAYPCNLCDSIVCAKCIVPIELHEVEPKLKLVSKKVRLCPECDKFISKVNSYKVARQEILAGRYEKQGTGCTTVDPFRISQLTEDSSAWPEEDYYPGELYEFGSDQRSPSTVGSLNAFAELTSSSDSAQIIEVRGRSSDGSSLPRGTARNEEELDMMVENVWRSSISELDLKERERDRQLAWLKMTELRLRLDDSTPVR